MAHGVHQRSIAGWLSRIYEVFVAEALAEYCRSSTEGDNCNEQCSLRWTRSSAVAAGPRGAAFHLKVLVS